MVFMMDRCNVEKNVQQFARLVRQSRPRQSATGGTSPPRTPPPTSMYSFRDFAIKLFVSLHVYLGCSRLLTFVADCRTLPPLHDSVPGPAIFPLILCHVSACDNVQS